MVGNMATSFDLGGTSSGFQIRAAANRHNEHLGLTLPRWVEHEKELLLAQPNVTLIGMDSWT